MVASSIPPFHPTLCPLSIFSSFTSTTTLLFPNWTFEGDDRPRLLLLSLVYYLSVSSSAPLTFAFPLRLRERETHKSHCYAPKSPPSSPSPFWSFVKRDVIHTHKLSQDGSSEEPLTPFSSLPRQAFFSSEGATRGERIIRSPKGGPEMTWRI